MDRIELKELLIGKWLEDDSVNHKSQLSDWIRDNIPVAMLDGHCQLMNGI